MSNVESDSIGLAGAVANPRPTVRVVVAVGPRLLCDALATRLGAEEDLHVIGVPGTAASALVAIRSLMPSVVVFDPDASADPDLSLLTALPSVSGSPAAVGLVSKTNLDLASKLVRAGAVATVLKTAPIQELLVAVRSAACGEGWISPQLIRGVLGGLYREPGQHDARLKHLTAREREIVQLMVDGLGRQQIAKELYLSVDTIRTHLRTIMEKLSTHSATGVVSVALADGFRPRR